jgi:signal transduction histidine kinase
MKVGLDATIPKYPRRFRRRVFFSITLITLLSAAAAFGFYFLRQHRFVHQDRAERGRLLARNLAGRADLGLYSGNTAFLEQPVESLMKQKDVLFVTVHDDSGKVIYEKRSPEESERTDPKPLPVKVLKDEAFSQDRPWTRSEARYVEFVLPVLISEADGPQVAFGSHQEAKKHTIGWVRIGLSTAPAKKKLAKILNLSLYMSGGLFAFGLLAAALVTWRLTGPISRLTRSVNEIRKGNLDQRVEIKSHDELGQLGDAFNRMAWNLKEAMGKLERLNKNLEAEVASRTEDIRSISEFVKVLNEPLEIKPLIDAALVSFKKLTGCTAAALFRHGSNDTLELAGQVGGSSDAFGPRKVGVGERNVGRAAQGDEPLLIEEVPENARLCRAVGTELTAVVYFPIRFGEGLEGVLVAASDKELDSSRLDLMGQAVHQLAVALANARAYESSQTLAKELEHRNVALVRQRDLLQKQKLQLLEANKLKSEFLANTTHELRTPLNAVIGYAGLVLEEVYGEINSDQREALRGIAESAQSLLGLINQTLDYAKLEAGQMPVVVSDVDLVKLVEDTVSASQGLTKDKPYRIALHLPSEPVEVKTDEGKVRQILTNLLSNAIKFTDRGSVTVSLRRTDRSGAVLDVTDTGVGIAEEDQEIIFDAFRQLDGSSTRAAGGTGLGLAISRRFAALVGARLEVESAKGGGSTFCLKLPAEPPTNAQKVDARDIATLDDVSATMGVGPESAGLDEMHPARPVEGGGRVSSEHPDGPALAGAPEPQVELELGDLDDGREEDTDTPKQPDPELREEISTEEEPELELELELSPGRFDGGSSSSTEGTQSSGLELDTEGTFPTGGWNERAGAKGKGRGSE